MTAETPRTTALRNILLSVGTAEALCLQLAEELERDLTAAQQALRDHLESEAFETRRADRAQADLTAARAREDQLTAQLADANNTIYRLEGRTCLLCGAVKPCMTEADLQPDDPGIPCTFDPSPIDAAKRFFEERNTQRARATELDGTVRLLSTVQTQLISERDAARARVAELEAFIREFLIAAMNAADANRFLESTAQDARALLSPSPEPQP